MDKITVRKEDLLDKLKKQLKDHKQEYEKAHKGWKQAVLKALQKETQRVLDGKKPNLGFLDRLPEPSTFEEEISQAISLLEWEEADTVDLTFDQHKQWVLGEWRWKAHFAASNRAYA